MAYFRCGGGGIPSSLKTDMNAVYNKKFGTSTVYDPSVWASTANLMGPLPERTASGSIAAITDGAEEVPLKSWEIEIGPDLSGKSSVVCTQTGKNLFDNTSLFPMSGSVSSYYFKQFDYNSNLVPQITLQAGVTYTFSLDITSTIEPFNFSVGCGNGSYSSDILTVFNKSNGRISITFTPTAAQLNNGNIFAFRCPRYQTQNTFDYSVSNVQLEVGSTATTYEAYTAPVINTVSLGRTVYGGTVDVVNGTGTDAYGIITFDGSNDENWQDYSSYNGFYIAISQMKVGTRQDGVTNYLTNSSTSAHTQDTYWLGVNSNRLFLIEVYNTMGSSISDLRSYLSEHPLTVVFPLATETDFTFTPITPTPETPSGVSNFWGDTGDSEVTYRADIDLLLGGN